jgi:type IV secretory pathway TraG/TraD family ATPase VirD4
MSLNDRIGQYFSEKNDQLFELVLPLANGFFSHSQEFWLEAIFLFLFLMLFFIPYCSICKNESSFKVSCIRFLGRVGTSVSCILALVLSLLIAYVSSYDNFYSLNFILKFGEFSDVPSLVETIKNYSVALTIFAALNFIFVKKFYEPKLSSDSIKKTKKIGQDEAFTDVRDIYNEKPLKEFNPKKYFANAGKKDALFFGLDDDRKPLFISRNVYNKTNIQVSGSMGAGKGVQAQIILSQQVRNDDAVIVFDPKFDDYLQYVLKQACEETGKPFFFFNLREAVPQINPFAGANEEEIAELFIAAFDIEETGTDADVYKISAQKSAQKIATYIVENDLYLSQVPEHLPQILSDDEVKMSRSLIEKIETLSRLRALQACSQTIISDVMKKGGVVYIVGDDVGVIKNAQKMLLVRVFQLVKNIRSTERKFVSIFADEVKALLCPLFVNQSGQLRSRRANLIYAHQTDADLEVIGSNNAAILKGNSTLRWFYRQQSPNAALEVAKLTGTIKAQSSSYINENNGLGDEVRSNEGRRSIEQEAYYIDVNTIQNLPMHKAVLIGDGLAKLGFSSPIKIDNTYSIPAHEAPQSPDLCSIEQALFVEKEEDDLDTNFTPPDFLETLKR